MDESVRLADLGFGIWKFREAAVPLSGQWNPTTEAFPSRPAFYSRPQAIGSVRLRTLSKAVARPLQ